MAGLNNKGEDFWKYVESFDFIGLCETWIEEKDWEVLKGKLPKTHEWGCSYAKRDKNKGRAKGGIVIGKRKEWGEVGSRVICKEQVGVIKSEIRKKWER